MATFTVSDDLINSADAAAYFLNGDRRIMVGLRATLEMLSLPVPDYAIRRKPGRTPARDVALAYAADHHSPRPLALRPRKPNATPERIAALAARNRRI